MFGLTAPSARAALSTNFGINGAVPSSSADSDKQALVDNIADLGMGWNRHEFHYADTLDFGPYDAAQTKLDAKGIKTELSNILWRFLMQLENTF